MKKIVILGAGLPHFGTDPSLCLDVGGLSVLQWQLSSFKGIQASVDVVVGFKAVEQKEQESEVVHFIENSDWETTQSGGSLLKVNLENIEELWVSYGDILYYSQTIQKIRDQLQQAIVVYDSEWRMRYNGCGPYDISLVEKVVIANKKVQRLGSDIKERWASGEFVGLVLLRGEALTQLKLLMRNNDLELDNLALPDLLELMRLNGVEFDGYDVKGQWVELNEPRDLAHFVMGTKAETLARLRTLVTASCIQDQVSFSVAEWKIGQAKLIDAAKTRLEGDKLVVRSSARSEDGFTQSNAGAYSSLLNVKKNETSIRIAVEEVVASYHNQKDDDQVLIQPMITDVVMSGVVFTRTLEHAAPYFVINYDESGSTESITSGHASKNSVFYCQKKATVIVSCQKLEKLVAAIQEIETLLNYDALDIEFAVDSNDAVHVFQVRPITLHRRVPESRDKYITDKLKQAVKLYERAECPTGNVVGKKVIYGNMPDWNPAEIIGTNPGELAYSLYGYLILDEIWAQQRAECGYRDVRPQSLLKRFAGKPYIDVRASFSSFLPGNLPDDLSERLVDFYSGWLVENPHLHDKIEFDVIPTCVGLGFARWESRLSKEGGFLEHEIDLIKQGLLEITNNVITRVEGDLKQVNSFEEKLMKISPGNACSLYQIKALLDECKVFGTLLFAHLARAGFIAVTFLKEAVLTGVLSTKAQEDFLAGLKTVSHTLSEDAYRVKKRKMSWDQFVRKYGHLRPGTYDITSLAYHEDTARFLAPLVENARNICVESAPSAWEQEKSLFFIQLRNEGVQGSDEQIENFMRLAIEGREKAKFIFTRSLSMVLDGLVKWGIENKLKREVLAELPASRLFEYLDQSSLTNEQIAGLYNQANLYKEERILSLACELPPLLTSLRDFQFFTLNESHPNYIGSTKVTGAVVILGSQSKDTSVEGRIIMIPQADPGYDWLFGQGISGIITMHGGANSHMAIRSAEFGLSAAIGVGENLYRKYSQAQTLELDPANSIIRIIN